jgi:hypothetical protein
LDSAFGTELYKRPWNLEYVPGNSAYTVQQVIAPPGVQGARLSAGTLLVRSAYTFSMKLPDTQAAGKLCEPDEDDSLIGWMLSLTPAERLAVLQGFVDSVSELRREQPTAIQRRA